MTFSTVSHSLRLLLAGITVTGLQACGAGDARTPAKPVLLAQLSAAPAVAQDYQALVQQLYIAYFGRPADPLGLTNFSARLAQLAAPLDLGGLDLAYGSNAGVRELVNSFASSAESAALYTGDTEAFVTSIYRNMLNRAPDAEGKAYWTGAINRGDLTRAKAALSIAAGALSNTSPDGKLDAALSLSRVAAATAFVNAIVTDEQRDAYSGDAAAAAARIWLSGVTAATSGAAVQSGVTATMDALGGALRYNLLDTVRNLYSQPRSWVMSGASFGVAVPMSVNLRFTPGESGGTLIVGNQETRWVVIDTVESWAATASTGTQSQSHRDALYFSVDNVQQNMIMGLSDASLTMTDGQGSWPTSAKIGDVGSAGSAVFYTGYPTNPTVVATVSYSWDLKRENGRVLLCHSFTTKTVGISSTVLPDGGSRCHQIGAGGTIGSYARVQINYPHGLGHLVATQ